MIKSIWTSEYVILPHWRTSYRFRPKSTNKFNPFRVLAFAVALPAATMPFAFTSVSPVSSGKVKSRSPSFVIYCSGGPAFRIVFNMVLFRRWRGWVAKLPDEDDDDDDVDTTAFTTRNVTRNVNNVVSSHYCVVIRVNKVDGSVCWQEATASQSVSAKWISGSHKVVGWLVEMITVCLITTCCWWFDFMAARPVISDWLLRTS